MGELIPVFTKHKEHAKMDKKQTYFEQVIKSMPSEDAVAEFLNKPEIMAKWSDEDREFFIVSYLKSKGWKEVTEPETELKANNKKRVKK